MEKFEQRLSKDVKTYFQEFSDRELQLIKNPVFSDIDFIEEDSQLVSSLENQTEYLGRKLSTNTSVPGNIHRPRFREFWEKELEAPQFVMDTLSVGYSLPFAELPPPSFERNNKSAREDMVFVREEVKRLEALGCIKRVQHRPRCVLPLSSVFSKKKRLVVDGSRCLNPLVVHRKICLQDHRVIPNLVKPGVWMATNDLDSGYWHIAINPEHWTYLGIHVVEEDGSTSFYVWVVMFLGISDAVFMFTTMLKPIRRYLAMRGVPNCIYIDDLLTLGLNRSLCVKNTEFAVWVLSMAGWVVSPSKATGPAPRLTFLGLDICSESLKFFIPEKKLADIKELLAKYLRYNKMSARQLAKVVGKIQSCWRALGPVVRVMTRSCYSFICKSVDTYAWDYFQPLSKKARRELSFWRDNISDLHGYSFSPVMSKEVVDVVVASDASGVGLFAYLVDSSKEVLGKRALSAEERTTSSTFREILALKEVYLGKEASRFSGLCVRHLTDNRGVAAAMEFGSPKEHIQEVVLDIFNQCRRLNIRLLVEWRSREDPAIQYADQGSRWFDESSYGLNFDSFYFLVSQFSHLDLDVDCMAQRFPEERSSGVNFFAQKLSRDITYYCFPPPGNLVPSFLHFMKHGAHGLLVFPDWRSASFWTFVAPDGVHFGSRIKAFVRFLPSGFDVEEGIISGTFKRVPSFHMFGVEFDFRN